MHVIPHTVQPRSTLTPSQVRQKFASRSLAGLGDCMYDDSGNVTYCDSVPSSGVTVPDTGGSLWTLGNAITFTQPVTSVDGGTLPGYAGANGTIIIPYVGGGYTIVNPDGSTSDQQGTPPSPSAGGAARATTQQSNAWASIISSLTNAGVQIAKVTSLQPGQTLLPNGTIVGAGQTLIPGGGVTSNPFTAILSNPTMLMMVALGLLVFGAVEK